MGSGAAQRRLTEASEPRARHPNGWILALAIGAGAALLLSSGAPLCPLAGWVGIPCPGCGLTRASLALLRGDVAAAVRLHPLVFVAAPAFLLLTGSALRGALGTPPQTTAPGRGLGRWARLWNFAAGALVVALLGVWVLRFLGYFGGPAPVTTYAEWWRGDADQTLNRK